MYDDPLDEVCGDATAWTTVNVAENMPRVPTPLTWSLFVRANEMGAGRSMHRLGIYRRAEAVFRASADDRMFAIFAGHPAINLDRVRHIANRTPGASADEQERQFFGLERDVQDRPTRRRYPFIAAKAPLVVATLPSRLRRAQRESLDWRRARLHDLESGVDPRHVLREATSALEDAHTLHALGTILSSTVLQQLAAVCQAAGLAGLENEIGVGTGELVENALVRDLWAVAHGRMALDDFLGLHGHQAPQGLELSEPSWREEPALVDRLVDGYRGLPAEADPALAASRRKEAKAASLARLLERTRGVDRVQARLVAAMAARFGPLRELGKDHFVQVFDVARAASRQLGLDLVARGELDAPDDVMHLTLSELVAPRLPPDVRGLVAFRRGRREEHLRVEVPSQWVGKVPRIETGASAVVDDIRGVGASPGTVEGVARVVVDPAAEVVEPGEILVCGTTDPSWVGLMYLSSALVIDIGGLMSHGAIIARELGVPCVINTKTGTTSLRTGDVIRVDGTDGVVEILSRSAPGTARRE